MKNIPVRNIASNTAVNQAQFSVRRVEDIMQGSDLQHDLHRHDFFFVLAVQAGQGVHEIDFVEYVVRDNSVFILRPGQVHKLSLKAGSTGYLLEFAPSFYQPQNGIGDRRWKKATSKSYCQAEADKFLKLRTILANVLTEFDQQQEGYIDAIRANLELFFIEYIRQSRQPGNVSKTEGLYVQQRFEELMVAMEANIGKLKNVSQYAELLSLSPYQLNSITKSSVGKTVSDLINEQIILEAKRHLLATGNQVKDIAWDLGYEDVSYFIRFFKKQTGHSPEAFRKNFK